ncbi:hypothetical protein NDU88_004810 [Pleurodeles waltl]|uniref:Uncharacterized protein n=1 Tax=Pleurodeles waltl TaxID=8319 RepID=A0AAV7UGA9_PLEWA|nr:hypothetical protein NDU88_004810 [Pleurodeles waltl]
MIRENQSPDAGFAQRAAVEPTSSAYIFMQMATSFRKDHEYGAGVTLGPSEFFPTQAVAADSGSPFITKIVFPYSTSDDARTLGENKFDNVIGPPLEPTDVNPENFTGEKIDMLGYRLLIDTTAKQTNIKLQT